MLENVSSSTTPNSIVSNASGQPALQFGPVNDALLNKAQPSPTRLGHNDDPDDAPSVLDEVPASNAQQGLTDDGDLPSSPGLTPGAGKDQPLINAACVDKGASAAGLLSPFKQVTSTTDTPESALSSASNPDEHAPHVTEGIDPAAADEVALEGSENTGSDNFITTVSTEAMAALAIRSHLRSRHGVITDRLEPGQLMSLDEVAQVCLLT
ncbi:hypothetical protein DFH09DRAFT_1302533 [Mycena vulgaris]|nr:hypothetical protein DFH09DRAFT_1302533 [Mycena vulgaris]